MALYIAQIVTIVRHKKFHSSFYALFVMRAISDLLYVLDTFYGQRLPLIIGAVLYPIYSNLPNWMLAMFFFIAGHTFQANNLVTVFSSTKLKMRRTAFATNGANADSIERKLLIYALATFLGHALVESLFLIRIIANLNEQAINLVYYPLVMDTGTVVLSSWLLLWASGTFRQQMIKDFSIIRVTNRSNNRVNAMEGPQNNNHRPVGGAVGHQLQNRICSSGQQLPTIS
uniref:Serpentine receptor class gamma n=1 Tax=Globodera pallida TaxID=36090 RepID=A0A183BZ49_GLOPA